MILKAKASRFLNASYHFLFNHGLMIESLFLGVIGGLILWVKRKQSISPCGTVPRIRSGQMGILTQRGHLGGEAFIWISPVSNNTKSGDTCHAGQPF